jgi:hypothetical protein
MTDRTRTISEQEVKLLKAELGSENYQLLEEHVAYVDKDVRVNGGSPNIYSTSTIFVTVVLHNSYKLKYNRTCIESDLDLMYYSLINEAMDDLKPLLIFYKLQRAWEVNRVTCNPNDNYEGYR